MRQSELKLILSINTDVIKALAHLEVSLERISKEYLARLDKPMKQLDDMLALQKESFTLRAKRLSLKKSRLGLAKTILDRR